MINIHKKNQNIPLVRVFIFQKRCLNIKKDPKIVDDS